MKYYPMLPLRWKVEVHIVLGCDRHAVEGGRLIAPLAKSGDDFFVDAVADRLYNSGLDDVALRVDGDLDNHISLKVARQFRARYGWIRKHNRVGHMHFMAFDRSVNHGAQRRTGTHIVIGGFRVG